MENIIGQIRWNIFRSIQSQLCPRQVADRNGRIRHHVLSIEEIVGSRYRHITLSGVLYDYLKGLCAVEGNTSGQLGQREAGEESSGAKHVK